MKRALMIVSTVLFVGAAHAGPTEDSLALLNVMIEASSNLAPAIEGWDAAASKSTEAMLRSLVLEPLEASRNVWFDAGMNFVSQDDNPYLPFMVCYDAANQLRYQAIELIRFHSGSLKAEFVKFENVEPAVELMDACLVALKQ